MLLNMITAAASGLHSHPQSIVFVYKHAYDATLVVCHFTFGIRICHPSEPRAELEALKMALAQHR